MVNPRALLLCLFHLGSARPTTIPNSKTDFEMCIEADLKQVEALKEELFNALPPKETKASKGETSFGLLHEDWDRLHILENKLPNNSILKPRLVNAFRLLIGAIYQAHLKQPYQLNYGQRGEIKPLILVQPRNVSEGVHVIESATDEKPKDTNDTFRTTWPGLTTVILNKGQVGTDNEIAGSDIDETELPYTSSSSASVPSIDSSSTLIAATYTANIYDLISDNTSTTLNSYQKVISTSYVQDALSTSSMADFETTNSNVNMTSPSITTTSPINTTLADVITYQDSREPTIDKGYVMSSITFLINDKSSTTTEYDESSYDARALNMTVSTKNIETSTEYSNGLLKNTTFIFEQLNSRERITYVDSGTTTEEFKDNIEVTPQVTSTIQTISTSYPFIAPEDKLAENDISENINPVEHNILVSSTAPKQVTSFRTTAITTSSLPDYFDNSLYDEDRTYKVFPDDGVEFPDSKDAVDHLDRRKGPTTTVTPNDRFKYFTIVLGNIYESRTNDVSTNTLNIYRKGNYPESHSPEVPPKSGCGSGKQCVLVEYVEYPLPTPKLQGGDQPVHTVYADGKVPSDPYFKYYGNKGQGLETLYKRDTLIHNVNNTKR